jgi:HEAT repeat protein
MPKPVGFGEWKGYADFDDRGLMYLAQAQQQQIRRTQNEERAYESGHNAIRDNRYDEALGYFNQVVAIGGSRADAGLYYKAYSLNKLGRREEALAAIAELRKQYSSSKWLDDAKALELEVKQRSGQPVSPESQSDEELKLMAINGLMQSDPDRAIPLLETLLKGSHSPKLKERVLFVLAQSNTPRAQQVIQQIARGGANPDLQLMAVRSIANMGRRQGGNTTPAILPEIYASTADLRIKRTILNAYTANRDTPRVLEIAKNEKAPEIRNEAFKYLGSINGQPELWQIYQTETSPEVKQQMLDVMHQNGNAERLAQVARSETDPAVRRLAVRVLARQRVPATADSLVAIYNAEQDERNKREIISMLHSQRNATALVALARNEKDMKLKMQIIDRLGDMKSKEASDYLAEILSK